MRLTWFSLVLALTAGAGVAQAGPTVEVEAGIDGKLVAGRWNPVTFRISSPALAEVEIQVGTEEGRARAALIEARVTRQVTVKGLRVETLIVWIDGGRPVRVSARSGERLLLDSEERPVTETALTVALTSNLGALANVPEIPGHLVVTRPEALAQGLLAYDPIDTLVIGDLAGLVDWSTVRDFVVTGRHLVLIGQDAILAAGEMSPIGPDGRPRVGAQARPGEPLAGRWRWGAGWVDGVWSEGPLTVVPVQAAAAVAGALQPPPRLNLERVLLAAESELARELRVALPATEALVLGVALVVIGGFVLSLSRDNPRRLLAAVIGSTVLAVTGWVWLRSQAGESGGIAELHLKAGSARGGVQVSLQTSLHPSGGDRRWDRPVRVLHSPAGGPVEAISFDDHNLTVRVAPWTRVNLIRGPRPATLVVASHRQDGLMVLESSVDLRQIWLVGHGWLGPRSAGRHTLVPVRAEAAGVPGYPVIGAVIQALDAGLPPGTLLAWAGGDEVIVVLEGS